MTTKLKQCYQWCKAAICVASLLCVVISTLISNDQRGHVYWEFFTGPWTVWKLNQTETRNTLKTKYRCHYKYLHIKLSKHANGWTISMWALLFPFVDSGGQDKSSLLLNQQREIIALDRQGTQQQRPESPTVAPPGMRVNTRYINSTKGTSSKKDAPSGIYTLHFRHTRRHSCVQIYEKNQFLFKTRHSP